MSIFLIFFEFNVDFFSRLFYNIYIINNKLRIKISKYLHVLLCDGGVYYE